MPIPSNPPYLLDVIGSQADVFSIPETTPEGSGALSYTSGWPQIVATALSAGGLPPQREYFNAVNKLLSQHVFFLQSGGVYPWQATLDYIAGCHVLGSDDVEYIALQSSGPDISAGAKDPVQEANRTYWVSLTSFVSRGFVQNSRKVIAGTGLSGGGALSNDITISLSKTNSANIDAAEALRKTWIGIPRPWRSTALPDGFVWADGGLVLFEDYPELEEVYNSGGFAGMLLDWNATEEIIAANLGKWRPNASNPTGVYTPFCGGQFSRAWVPGQSMDAGREAGSFQRDELKAHAHRYGYVGDTNGFHTDPIDTAFFYSGDAWSTTSTGGSETRPMNIAQPYAIYLGVIK